MRAFVCARRLALTTPTLRSWWQGAATVSSRALHAVGAAGKPPGRWRCVHSWHACIPYGADVRARLMCSQAVEGQWSSHTMDFYDCTRRGQLHWVMVHTGVQWCATRRCARRARARRARRLVSTSYGVSEQVFSGAMSKLYVSTCSLERHLSVTLYACPGHRRSPGWLFCLL